MSKEEQYREALQLVREGLDIPHAKTAGGDVQRMEILFLRTVDLLIMVSHILDGDNRPEFTLGYCRDGLAKHAAVGYHPARAPIAYGQYDKCASGDCGHAQGSHWEYAEPDGERKGCAFLGCPCLQYAAPASDSGWISGSMKTEADGDKL